MAGSSDAYVLGPGEGRTIALGAFAMTVKAEPGRTDGALSMLEAEEPPGFGPPLHIHHDADEAFYVLEGEYVIFLDEREVRCRAGAFVWIPKGMVHGFRVGEVASRKLNIYSPAAMTGYFDDLGAALADGVDDEALGAIAERYAMEIVGPVPEGYA